MFMSHKEIWQAIDKLAESKGLSASGLAIKAQLDPTVFNKSKRKGKDGHKRLPSMESLNRIISVTGVSVYDFIKLGNDTDKGPSVTVPLLGLAQAGKAGYFDDMGYPVGSANWDAIEFPGGLPQKTYALEVSGNSMLPTYREGDRLIVSPEEQTRKGDRVVVRTKKGEVMVKELKRQTAMQIELKSLNPEHEDRAFEMNEIEWISRVLWVSQ